MNDRLTAVIERVRSDESIPALDEANVKQGVILPVLNALGWDPFNIDEVKPEYSVGGGNVDYALRLDGKPRVFLEAKRPKEDLTIHQAQLLGYAFAHGVPLAALTNGLKWWFYRPSGEGNWEERRFCVIDLRMGDISTALALLTRFLSKGTVGSGEAVKDAELHLEILRMDKEIEETLPNAWDQIITEPDEILVELLIQKVKELCGWETAPDEIIRFLSRLPKPGLAPSTPSITLMDSRAQMSGQQLKIDADYTNTKPLRFTFRGQTHEIEDRKWNTLLPTLAEQIYQLHPTEFHKAHEVKLRWLTYFNLNSQNMRRPKPVGNSGYYVETKMKANRCVMVCHKLLIKFGYSQQDLVIETA